MTELTDQDIVTSAKLSYNIYKKQTTRFFFNSWSEIEGSYFLLEDNFWLVIQGTVSKRTWEINFKSFIEYSETIRIHPGFDETFNQLQPQLFDLIGGFTKYNQAVYLTGHSAGAAVATRIALEIQDYRTVYLITYGSPRVGNQAFVDQLEGGKTLGLRVYNPYDVVTHVPTPLQGYVHFGTPINSGSIGHSMKKYYDAIVKMHQTGRIL